MIDKITPSPDMTVGRDAGEGRPARLHPVRNERGTVTAPYVNAEETEYLVIEDSFPNGRLPLDKAPKIIYTDRATVDKVERMKVTTASTRCTRRLRYTAACWAMTVSGKK